MVAQQHGKLEEAEDLYRQGLEIARELGDRPGEAASLLQLGTMAGMRGKLEEAEDLFRHGFEIARAGGDRAMQAQVLYQFGIVAQIREKLEEAEVLYRQARDGFVEIGDRPDEARTLAQMALLAEAQGDVGSAVERMERAVAMMEEMGLGQAEQAKGDLDRLRKRLEEEQGEAKS